MLQTRVRACLQALAIGDAIGKQTETLSRSDVLRWYPDGITGFHGTPGDVIPRYAGRRYEWRIGETTDDTEQTLAVARAILREPAVYHEAIGRELLQCRKSLHPGVSLWNFVQSADPARIAPDGDGCGAAMRVAPIGILYPPTRADDLIRAARECAIPTHGGPVGIAAATAVACAVSAAVDDWPPSEILAFALNVAGPDLGPVVPVAIGLALTTLSADRTALMAANLGGDADTIGSIAGAIAGALRPETVNQKWFDIVTAINQDPIVELASSLAALRFSISQ